MNKAQLLTIYKCNAGYSSKFNDYANELGSCQLILGRDNR